MRRCSFFWGGSEKIRNIDIGGNRRVVKGRNRLRGKKTEDISEVGCTIQGRQ